MVLKYGNISGCFPHCGDLFHRVNITAMKITHVRERGTGGEREGQGEGEEGG